ncbi:MAG TPA: glycosyltransferase, partial [Cyanobacteria bacterium UBA11366]|nr:glycosyltransferase [Cyanobacteria bacterium UBA11366]
MFQGRKEFPVMGLPVHLEDDYNSWLGSRLQQKIGSHVVTLNAEMVMQAESNPALAHVIQKAELVIPDGAGVIFYLLLYGERQQRCPGIELAESLLQQVGTLGKSFPVFFYGGKPGVAEAAATVWLSKLPEIAIAGIRDGYLSSEGENELKATLKATQPSLILVGLGVPRQELWIAENRHLCPQATWIG